MPPRREDSKITRLVSEQLVAALPNIVSQMATGTSATSGNNRGSGSTEDRECTYKAFRTCDTKEFDGTEGAVGLLTWIEGMESVLHISKCTEGKQSGVCRLFTTRTSIDLVEYSGANSSSGSSQQSYVGGFQKNAERRMLSEERNPEVGSGAMES